eukprot:1391033-Pleurochrysis_carterae.AAC.3
MCGPEQAPAPCEGDELPGLVLLRASEGVHPGLPLSLRRQRLTECSREMEYIQFRYVSSYLGHLAPEEPSDFVCTAI